MWWWIGGIAIYIVGFVLTMIVHVQLPVTRGLALLRAAVWPVYITTGWPRGEPTMMD